VETPPGGGGAAAHLEGLLDEAPDEIAILIPHGQRQGSRPPWVFVRENGDFRASSRGNPPRICTEDAVLDLCAAAQPSDVVGLVTTSVQRRLTTPERLRSALDRRARQRHRQIILDLISDVAQGAESPLEVRYVRDVERAHGLPRGTRQSRSRSRQHIRDVDYKTYGVVVELDGRLGHTGMGRFRDMWRDNEAVAENRVTLRYGAVDLYRRPCEVALQVASILVQRGWTGLPARCDRCRRVA
jgi:hypothetical protein